MNMDWHYDEWKNNSHVKGPITLEKLHDILKEIKRDDRNEPLEVVRICSNYTDKLAELREMMVELQNSLKPHHDHAKKRLKKITLRLMDS